ncbi:AAA family ATPase [Streptomyces sp. NPDC040724]|uniref:AAA family ATPase n=1 Tax=Streptomyces sp. NPDC040724 TaxID=3155612 RepID=UPI0033E4768A
MDRIVVIGTSGSGKSTLAGRLAARLGLVHLELDAFVHGPGWKSVPQVTFRRTLEERMATGGWVCDGNYFDRTDWVWQQADTVIWLDMPLRLVLPRLVRRSIQRIVTREELWNGNREEWTALVGRDSVLTWAVKSHRRHAAELPARLEALEKDGLAVERLCSPREVDQWWSRTFPDASGTENRPGIDGRH